MTATAPTGDLTAFLQKVHDSPDNDVPRLVFADADSDRISAPGGSRYLTARHFTTPDEGAMQRQSTESAQRYKRERIIYDGMIRRCYATAATNYRYYGGRGIAVCERWKGHFQTFLADMGPRPSPLHTLDRIDNDGPYSPENCRWATRQEQARNRRTSRRLEYGGKSLTLTEWSKVVGISREVIEKRLDKLGWSVADALTQPITSRAECGRLGLGSRRGHA